MMALPQPPRHRKRRQRLQGKTIFQLVGGHLGGTWGHLPPQSRSFFFWISDVLRLEIAYTASEAGEQVRSLKWPCHKCPSNTEDVLFRCSVRLSMHCRTHPQHYRCGHCLIREYDEGVRPIDGAEICLLPRPILFVSASAKMRILPLHFSLRHVLEKSTSYGNSVEKAVAVSALRRY
jgi:predicted RNA-binding Zn-ribbon protein involved in translation (DUF1610 family)